MLRIPFTYVRNHVGIAAALALLVTPLAASAQIQLPSSFGTRGGGFGASDAADPVTVTAQFTAATSERPSVLIVTAKIAPGWHVYSLTQPAGGPQKTEIQLAEDASYRLLGPFLPIPEYKSHIDDIAWVGLELQEHEGEVTWYAPVELEANVDVLQFTIDGTLRGQACQESCIPIRIPFSASLGRGVPIGPLEFYPPSSAPAAVAPVQATLPAFTDEPFETENSGVRVSGLLFPSTVRPANTAELALRLEPPAGWHVYAWAPEDNAIGSKPTLITVETTSGLDVGQPTTDEPVEDVDQSDIGWEPARVHHGAVTWRVPVRVPVETRYSSKKLVGFIGYQACEDGPAAEGSCEIPQGVRFEVTLNVGEATGTDAAVVNFVTAKYSEAAAAAERGTTSPPKQTTKATSAPVADVAGTGTASAENGYDLSRVEINDAAGSFVHYMVLAFIGGVILNLMPCVLPVIGLKIMSFVEQSGNSRSQALALNCWYSAGIVSVFLVLAGLAVTAGLSWGGQFGSTAFNVSLTALVFAMALSLLGVWEIPIPGFMGSGQAHELAAKEGPLGAFLKGVITTILATPCTGPFMATALGWAVRQPSGVTFSVFLSMGLGMASPYLLIGAYPSLIRFLPKPGAWMVTFKQIMGFVLLFTVVFLLSFMEPAAVVPTVLLLVGIGIACWAISRTPMTAQHSEQFRSWGVASAITLLSALVAFGWLYPMELKLATDQRWPAFSLNKLGQMAVNEGRTVLVDFSAEWCLTCKTLEKTVLHTKRIKQALDNRDIVTMYGDFTDYPEEIERTIKALGSNGVPVIAIFPGADPYRPIVFRGAYTQGSLLAAIERASAMMPDAVNPPTAHLSATLEP